ncbi:hypothetical protein C8Q74DRAFT_208038 [Fomes fomentarius]|nr:hypothetical protein C8Q74DRAFT_208038 [Fomes fomentarius]
MYHVQCRREPLKKNEVDWNKYPTIPAKNSIQPRPETAGTRWEPYVHPDGQLYFRFQNFYTNVYLYDEDSLKCIDATVAKLLDEISKHPELVLEHIEACLHLVDAKQDHRRYYYLVDKVKQEVFWLEDVDEHFLNDFENVSILSKEHLTLFARHLYWGHVIMFPHGRQYPLGRFAELQAELNYWILDKEFNPLSIVSYSTETINQFVQVLRDAQKLLPEERTPTPYVIVFAVLNYALVYERCIRYHGERYAQLDDDDSVHSSLDTRDSLWFKVIIWLFFFIPQDYAQRLRLLFVGKKVVHHKWHTFVTDLQEDWASSMTPTTVILATNVGFLAIQSVDNDRGQANRSAGQIISYISLILSISNIIVCAILSGILHRRLNLTDRNVVDYLYEHLETKTGREKLAIILSIPKAFFLWGLLTFLISIVWLCFHGTDITTRLVTGFMIVVSASFIGTVIHMGYGPPPGYLSATRKVSKKIRSRIGAIVNDVRRSKSDAVTASSPRWRIPRVHAGQNAPNDQSTPNTNDGGDVVPERIEEKEIGEKSPRRSIDAVINILSHIPPKALPTSTDSSTPNPLGSTGGGEDGGGSRKTKWSSEVELNMV